MALMLGVKASKLTRKQYLIAFVYIAAFAALNVFVYTVLGKNAYRTGYILWVQLPIMGLFRIISRYKGIKLFFVMLTTITFASIPVSATVAVTTFITDSELYKSLAFVLFASIMLAVIWFFLKSDFNYILHYSESKDFYKFLLIPLVYYFYGFFITGYDFTKKFGVNGFFLKRLPDIIVLVSYILVINIFRSNREKQVLKNEQALIEMHLLAAEQKLREMHAENEQAKIYRHDLRHHAVLLAGLAESGDVEKIKSYALQMQGNLDKITPENYCVNKTVDLILSSFAKKASELNLQLSVDAKLPAELNISDAELCTLLSNGIENAFDAAVKVQDKSRRTVFVSCNVTDNKLLVEIKNSYEGKVIMENAVPVSGFSGHGFGCRSIVIIAEKHNGLYDFNAKDGVFTLRLVMPLKDTAILKD